MSRRKLPSWMNASKQRNNSQSKDKDINNVQVDDAPFLKYGGRVVYCYQPQECNTLCEDILKTSKIVGFDIEWKVSYQTGVYHRTATVQLCTGEEKCYVFHIIHMTEIPYQLRCLLESSDVIKTGVGISGDVSRLYVDYNIQVNGVVDLSLLANQKLGNNEKWSLSNLLLNQVNKQLNKCANIRCSNWETLPLSAGQVKYAALDAFASWYLYQVLTLN